MKVAGLELWEIRAPFQGLVNCFGNLPRALPWASIGRAVGAGWQGA